MHSEKEFEKSAIGNLAPRDSSLMFLNVISYFSSYLKYSSANFSDGMSA